MINAGQQVDCMVAEAGPAAGERALMRAVLEDAIRCLGADAGPGRQRAQLAEDARGWITAADMRWPYSFQNVCEGLGLDASCIRQRLLRDAPAPTANADAIEVDRRGARPRRETPAEHDIMAMIREGRPLRVVAQTFGISISKASILSCGLASRMKASRDEEIRRLRADGWTHRALAARFGLSRIRIMRICARRGQPRNESRTAA
jgi:hypothetical protein